MRSQNTIKWTVVPQSTPLVYRTCPKCGQQSTYMNTNKFRVNANGKHVDVWLIYQCTHCKSTWNVTIYERVSVEALEPGLYQRFMDNDASLARDYGCDRHILSRCGGSIDSSTIEYDIIHYEDMTQKLIHSEQLVLEVICRYNMGIKMTQILAQGFGTSISNLKKVIDRDLIYMNGMTQKKLKSALLNQHKILQIPQVGAFVEGLGITKICAPEPNYQIK